LSHSGRVAAVDEGGAGVGLVRQGALVGQALEVVADKGLAGLDLDRDQLAAVIQEEVDFAAGLLAAVFADSTLDTKFAGPFWFVFIGGIWGPLAYSGAYCGTPLHPVASSFPASGG
jgi:hypothetical protein